MSSSFVVAATDCADGVGHGGVGVEAVDDDAAVDGDDVAFLEDALFAGNAVDDLVVDRGAEGGGIAVVALEGGDAHRVRRFLRRRCVSRSMVEAPGTTWGATASWTWRSAMPEMRIFSISAAVLIRMAIRQRGYQLARDS